MNVTVQPSWSYDLLFNGTCKAFKRSQTVEKQFNNRDCFTKSLPVYGRLVTFMAVCCHSELAIPIMEIKRYIKNM